MVYVSTRGNAPPVAAGQAIIQGLAPDGGLYVPENFPQFNRSMKEWVNLPYAELAFEILRLYLTDYSDEELRACVEKAYAYPENFDVPAIAPLTDEVYDNDLYFLELFHGRTLAFKDMALSLLPRLLTAAAKKYKTSEKTVILTATSGDTGKAALEGFAGVDGVEIIVFFPQDGVSDVQKLQMTTQEGSNVHVVGVRGNFDDTQTGVKKIFSDRALAERVKAKGIAFSSANSINVGRLLPQVAYYFYAYGQLVKNGAVSPGGGVDFTVPTGNFGNILAGYYALRMGLPIGKLICASNQNNVLYDFIRTGVYDANRPFVSTISPSMDILISSNLERLLYHVSNDPALIGKLMAELNAGGRYRFALPLARFQAAYATEAETRAALKEISGKGYVVDPHTAAAYHAYRENSAGGEGAPNVIIATASPFKFSADVLGAISAGEAAKDGGAFAQMDALARVSGLRIPRRLASLRGKEVRHRAVCEPREMTRAVEELL
ncbi:MAG: threonine synthase [Clostridiales bacterium]|jgi:threonine synthase|nr:threonine synthase [Clostridiales bacterium]